MNAFLTNECARELLYQLGQCQAPALWLVDENLPLGLIDSIPADLVQSLTAVTNRYDIHRVLTEAGANARLSDFDFGDLPLFKSIIYRIAKEKAQVQHCINCALQHLQPEGTLILIGKKNDGIKTIVKHAGKNAGQVLQARKKGNIYVGEIPALPDIDALLFDNHYPDLRQLEKDGLTFYSKPGIFGWDKIDQGSRLLMQCLTKLKLEKTNTMRLLDLGCGWGYLTLASREYTFASRCATDNNPAAVMATEKNTAFYALDVKVVLDDCAAGITGPFELILCNPPFHHGFAVDNRLIAQFLGSAKRLLSKNGQALFVVNEFVPLERHAQEIFTCVQLLDQQNGFKVFSLSDSY